MTKRVNDLMRWSCVIQCNSAVKQICVIPHSMLHTVTEWLWWERLWLPVNVSWADLEDREGRVYAKASQLYGVLPIALFLLFVRFLFERLVAAPLADVCGVKDRLRRTVEQNVVLENYFCTKAHVPSQADVRALCKKTSWTERRVQLWFRRRRNHQRPGLRKRFCEASWRCGFYFFAFVGGIVALHDKPWFYSLKEVWAGFPKQSLLESQYWYYFLEMGFYLSLLLSLTFDVKRKDFKEQVIHHIATLTLLAFSWISNYIRVGTIVMALHDSSDILLETCDFSFLGDPLHMGVSAGVVPCVLRLLFLQRHAAGAPDAACLLGRAHIKNALQVSLQQAGRGRQER
ncbi:ceramide synthase 2 isoform X3 [Festucalex cinctus]